MIALSGVRSSWLMLATNSALARLAWFAAAVRLRQIVRGRDERIQFAPELALLVEHLGEIERHHREIDRHAGHRDHADDLEILEVDRRGAARR